MFGYHAFGKRLLVINDLEMAKQIFIKDFDSFLDRRTLDLGHEYFNNMLVFLEGESWKEMRAITSPVFTSGKLKNMTKMRNAQATKVPMMEVSTHLRGTALYRSGSTNQRG